MRHKVYGKHLGRNKNERTALFKNLVQSLIISEKIETTEAKAKAVKGLVDKLITQAKSPATRRLISQFLVSKNTQDKLIKDIAPRLKSRTSGYTSLVKLGRRSGDGTMMVSLSLLTEAPKKVEEKKAGEVKVESEIKKVVKPKVATKKTAAKENK